jgi:two-component system, chemotaxis family, chemotaxis protein CheY
MPGVGIKDTAILLVEDERAMAVLISKLLEALGFHDISVASDGSVALDELAGRPFGLVLSDLFMEPMSGLQLLRAMRRSVRLRAIPFIMVTASADTAHIAEARRLGAAGYILKPFGANTLRRKLAKVLGDL